MSQTFYTLLTAVGEAKHANAVATGTEVNYSAMAVGDGNGNATLPNRLQTSLVNEVRRAAINQVGIDPDNDAQIIVEQVIPENVGGWWIREVGIFDNDGDLIAVANVPPTYKPQLQEGSGRTQVVRVVLLVSSTASVALKIDPAIVLATRQYVNEVVDSIPDATTSKRGLVELATNAETQSGEDASRAVTPAGLASRTATTSRAGLVELATANEAKALTDALRALTPATLKAVFDEVLGTAATRDVAENPLDATAGRILTVGSFGIGGMGGSPTNSINSKTRGELWASLHDTDIPLPQIGAGITMPYSHDWAFQIFSRISGSSTPFFRYRHDGSAWSPAYRFWTEINFNPNSKLDTSSVVQTTGSSTSSLMSQKAVTDALEGVHSLGVGQSWQDMSGSRANGTTYTNTTGRAIAVSIRESGDGTGSITIDGLVVAHVSGTGFDAQLFAIVPPGSSYSASGISAPHWRELR